MKPRPVRSSLLGNMGILAGAQVSSALLPLVTVPYVVRALGPTEYGKLAFGLAAVGFAGLIANPGVIAFGLREVARGSTPISPLVGQITTIRLIAACLAVTVVLAFGAISARPTDVIMLLLLLALTYPLTALDLGWVLQGRERMGWVSVGSVAGQLAYVGAIFLLVHEGAGAARMALAQFVSVVVALLFVGVPVLRGYGPPTLKGASGAIRVVVSQSVLLGLASFMSMIYIRVDTIMLEFMRGTTEVGYYAGSYKLAETMLMVQVVVGRAVFPHVSRLALSDLAATRVIITRYAGSLLVLGMPAVAGVLLTAPQIVALILGPGFAPSVAAFRVLSFVVLAGGFAGMYCGLVLVPFGRNRAYLLAVGAGAVVNVLLNIPLIPRYGAVAAAATTLAAQVTVAALAGWLARDRLRVPYLRLLPRPAAATTFMVLILWSARSLSNSLLFLVPLGMLTYLGAWMLMTRLSPGGALRVALGLNERR